MNETITDGTPLVFSLCRRRVNQHQLWTERSADEETGGAGVAEEMAEGWGRAVSFRIRSKANPELCVTAPPVHLD